MQQPCGKADLDTRFYNAHETSAVEDFAIALSCGDAEFKVSGPNVCGTLTILIVTWLAPDVFWCHHHRRKQDPVQGR